MSEDSTEVYEPTRPGHDISWAQEADLPDVTDRINETVHRLTEPFNGEIPSRIEITLVGDSQAQRWRVLIETTILMTPAPTPPTRSC